MLVFVDESGDTGLKLGRGSSAYFVATAVWFVDHDVANECDRCISELRTELRVTPEFHFTQTSHEKRKAFFDRVSIFEFRYTSIVINKAKLFGPGFKFKRSFYKAAVNYTMQNLIHELDNAKVILDKTGDRAFTKSMQSYLKKQTRQADGIARIRKVRAEDSKKNNLIQLADMVCGAVYRSYGDRPNPDGYRRMLRRREASVQFWPS